jgi:hypothetical protein
MPNNNVNDCMSVKTELELFFDYQRVYTHVLTRGVLKNNFVVDVDIARTESIFSTVAGLTVTVRVLPITQEHHEVYLVVRVVSNGHRDNENRRSGHTGVRETFLLVGSSMTSKKAAELVTKLALHPPLMHTCLFGAEGPTRAQQTARLRRLNAMPLTPPAATGV